MAQQHDTGREAARMAAARMAKQLACTLKTAITISVVKDCLVFMTEISCTDNFVQKSICGGRLPAQHAQRLPDLQEESLLHVHVLEYGTTVEYTCTLL